MHKESVNKLLIAVCAAFLVVFLQSCGIPQRETPRVWTPVYNAHTCGMTVQVAIPPGSYTKELTDSEMEILLPEKTLLQMSSKGIVTFLEDGTVYQAVLDLDSAGSSVMVYMGEKTELGACCVSREKDAKKSICGDVEYTIYRSEHTETKANVMAEAVINGAPLLIRMDSDNIDVDIAVFEAVLESFSWYTDSRPALSELSTAKAN